MSRVLRLCCTDTARIMESISHDIAENEKCQKGAKNSERAMPGEIHQVPPLISLGDAFVNHACMFEQFRSLRLRFTFHDLKLRL